MTKMTIITEVAFEKDCSLCKATEIYEKYKSKGKLDVLIEKLKKHEEV